MSHNCSHLDPRDIGMEKLQPLLIWSKDTELLEKYLPYIRDEFAEDIILLDINHINLNKKTRDIEKELEKYDFHFIKITDVDIELLLVDNTRYKIIFGDLEMELEKLVRKVIEWGKR